MQVKYKECPGGRVEDEGRDRRRKKRGRSNGTGTERGKWKREGDHGCHAVSYSICCSAEQSGAAGGGQASAHRGRGGREGERRSREKGGGRQSAQHLSSTRKGSTAGQAQERTLSHAHTEIHRVIDKERPGRL